MWLMIFDRARETKLALGFCFASLIKSARGRNKCALCLRFNYGDFVRGRVFCLNFHGSLETLLWLLCWDYWNRFLIRPKCFLLVFTLVPRPIDLTTWLGQCLGMRTKRHLRAEFQWYEPANRAGRGEEGQTRPDYRVVTMTTPAEAASFVAYECVFLFALCICNECCQRVLPGSVARACLGGRTTPCASMRSSQNSLHWKHFYFQCRVQTLWQQQQQQQQLASSLASECGQSFVWFLAQSLSWATWR